jgi:hypothetical protein
MPKLDPLIADELDANGINWSLESRGKHDAIVLTVNGSQRRVFIARTASDYRSTLNNRAEVRRRVRELGGTIVPREQQHVSRHRDVGPRPYPHVTVPVHAPAAPVVPAVAMSSLWTPPPFSHWEPPAAAVQIQLAPEPVSEPSLWPTSFELEGWT